MTYKILIVDPYYEKDDTSKAFIDSIVDFLKIEGHESSVNTRLDDMVSSDMSQTNGLLIHANPFEIEGVVDKLEALKKQYPLLGIIVTSGFSGSTKYHKFFTDSQGCYVLMKPFCADEIPRALDDFYAKSSRNSK